jgi:multicomponent K+:H+ antiporter subunit A
VVNVIIVDYRGFDTLGEITVLGIAALTHARAAGPGDGRQPLPAGLGGTAEGDRHPLMLQLAVRALVLPFVVLISVYLYLRGHNLPGGGFIAGLVLAHRAAADARGARPGWVHANAARC